MRFFPRRATFPGGVFLPDEVYARPDGASESLPLPEYAAVPLQHGSGPRARLLVAEGDRVEAEQVIARTDGDAGTAVHAPIAGRIRGVRNVDTTEDVDVPAVVIERDDASGESGDPGPPVERPGSADACLDRLADAGVVGFGNNGAAGIHALREARAHGVRHLILNGMDSEPGLSARQCLLLEFSDQVVSGAVELARLLEPRRILLAVDRQQRNGVKTLSARVRGTPIKLTPLPHKYPQAEPVLLVKSLLGREVPLGRTLLDAGVAVFDVATALAVHDAVVVGRPMTRRLVTVTGDGVGRPGNYWISVGTPLAHVIGHLELTAPLARIVAGGPMTGYAVDRLDVVTTRRTFALTLMTAQGLPGGGDVEPRACVRCGWCLDDCPVGIDAARLYHLAEQNDDARARMLHPSACIDCGVCSYACPSQLPLAEGIARLKIRMLHQNM